METDKPNINDDDENGELIEELDPLEQILNELLKIKQNNPLNANNDDNTPQSSSEKLEPASTLLNEMLEDLNDNEVDELFLLATHIKTQSNGAIQRKTQVVSPKPRRKYIDPRKTIRRMSRSVGRFAGFCNKESPSRGERDIDARHFLFIGDVSGSMGRYVTAVIYLLMSLECIARVDSYIFSDDITYASPFIKEGPFQVRYDRLRQRAVSWENGTRLCNAFREVLKDKQFYENTTVLLCTDGGFSLASSDWQETVSGIVALKQKIEKLYILTPNSQLADEGAKCGKKLWNVERAPQNGNDLTSPQLQKTARYGLLGRYSNEIMLCKNALDVLTIIRRFLELEL
jgi:uncharacterized protein with von Willebrand factor type A (vWA) domain